jgi:hypothetical protein
VMQAVSERHRHAGRWRRKVRLHPRRQMIQQGPNPFPR